MGNEAADDWIRLFNAESEMCIRDSITVGSALNLYGGKLDFDKVQAYAEEEL